MNRNQIIRAKLYLSFLISKRSTDYMCANNSKQKIIVTLAADYGNLGDVAITKAQTQFLQKHFPDSEVIEFPISKTFSHIKSLKGIIKQNDIITIVGGGNTGDLYDDIEYCRQFIIHQFPKNRIISFPQTIDFSNTSFGEKALKKAIKAYSKHKYLTLSAREEQSFNKFKKYFPHNKVLFLPDIVLSLNEEKSDCNRNDITLCLRSDREKLLSKTQEELLLQELSKEYEIKYYDTHIDKSNLSVEERIKELNKIWDAFRQSKLVITDRLHGMIFCAITNTPCIAIDNSNRKVSGVYNAWLKENSQIKVYENINTFEVMETIKCLLDETTINKHSVCQDRFYDLIKLLKE